jgi:hypothetical protein
MVQHRDLDRLLTWYGREPDTAQRVLALVFERNDELRWRAIEALGQLATRIADTDGLEKVRNLIRRLLWLMNDESGGIAWHGPEAIAEILYNVPELIDEYGRIVASFIDEPPFGPGAHWAIARLAPRHPDEFAQYRRTLRLDSDDPVERAYGLAGLTALDEGAGRQEAEKRLDDTGVIQIYDRSSGEIRQTTVGAIAAELTSLEISAA